MDFYRDMFCDESDVVPAFRHPATAKLAVRLPLVTALLGLPLGVCTGKFTSHPERLADGEVHLKEDRPEGPYGEVHIS
jgi:hypothetical protein